MTESHYAVLPHGIDLEGWTEEDKEDLDDYVRHMLHSKRSKFKQSMRAFGKYLSKRESWSPLILATLTPSSPWLSRHTLRCADHLVWSCLGAFLDWYDVLPMTLQLSH